MANRSSKLEWAEPPLSGCVPTGASSTWSSASRAMAAWAIAIWPWCGGSKVPPRKAMRIGASYRAALYPGAIPMPVAYIALGSNLDSQMATVRKCCPLQLSAWACLASVMARSSLYETEPVGYHDQPAFLNAVVALETELDTATVAACFAGNRAGAGAGPEPWPLQRPTYAGPRSFTHGRFHP